MRPLRIPSHIEDAIGEEGDERAIVIIIFADLVILKTAAERRQQQDRAAKLLRGHVILDATPEEPVEPIHSLEELLAFVAQVLTEARADEKHDHEETA